MSIKEQFLTRNEVYTVKTKISKRFIHLRNKKE